MRPVPVEVEEVQGVQEGRGVPRVRGVPPVQEVPALTGRLRVVAGVGVVLVVTAGLVLRFWTRSALWLDEALTVDIARLPLHDIPNALKHDGAPPLYYVLLHYWIVLFGQSNLAVRSLSGIIGVATLPVAWLCGRRFGGRAVAWTTLVLLASAPFAVYYSTESRMYALVILLTGCGFLALQRAIAAPNLWNMAAVAIVAAALLYTQYWSLYLIAITAIWLGVSILRSYHRGRPEDAPWRALIALGVGCLLFLPWVPTFIYQSKYTGTPWAAPPNFSAVINAVTGFTDNQGSTQATGTNQGRLLAIIYFAMLALALFGMGKSDRIVELDLRTRPRARGVTFVVVGTLFAAIAGGILSTSAFSSRYAAVVFLPLILLVALGTTTLLNPKARLDPCHGCGRRRPLLRRPEHLDAADAGDGGGGGHQPRGQAGGRDRVLSRPAGAGRRPADPRPLPVRPHHLPPRDRPRHRELGQLRPSRRQGHAPALLHRPAGQDGGGKAHLVGVAAALPDLRDQVRADRGHVADDVDQSRRRRSQRRDDSTSELLRADEPDRVHALHAVVLTTGCCQQGRLPSGGGAIGYVDPGQSPSGADIAPARHRALRSDLADRRSPPYRRCSRTKP